MYSSFAYVQSRKAIVPQDIITALDAIEAAVERVKEITQKAAEKHKISFDRQILELTGQHIGVLGEPYLEFEIATFELQLLKIMERLLGQVERVVFPTKNISPPVYGGRLRGGLYQLEDDLLQPPSRNLSSCFAGLDFFLPPQAGGEESPYQLKAIDLNSSITTQVEERIRIEVFRLEGRVGQKLDERRQQAVGLTHYIWHTQEDDRVRPTHAANDGELFVWGNPPAATGHPGQDYGCRCIAEPTLVDVGEPRIQIAGGPVWLIWAAIAARVEATRRKINKIQKIVKIPPKGRNAPSGGRTDTDWKFGKHKSDLKWQNRMIKGDWTPEDVTNTIKNGKEYPSPNNVNPGNNATRYQLGDRFVVRDDVTKEILQVSGSDYDPLTF